MTRVAETRTLEVFAGDGCVLAQVRASIVQTMADAQENLATAIAARGGRRCPLVLDLSKCEPLPSAVRRYYSAERVVEAFSALAVVVGVTPFGRTLANLYLRITRADIPTRLFTSTEEAIGWARTLHT
jgi:hypothetical protein